MVPVERIELPTFGLQNRCSTAELNRQSLQLQERAPPPKRPTVFLRHSRDGREAGWGLEYQSCGVSDQSKSSESGRHSGRNTAAKPALSAGAFRHCGRAPSRKRLMNPV